MKENLIVVVNRQKIRAVCWQYIEYLAMKTFSPFASSHIYLRDLFSGPEPFWHQRLVCFMEDACSTDGKEVGVG